MASRRTRFLGENAPLAARPFGARMIGPRLLKNIPILAAQKVGQSG